MAPTLNVELTLRSVFVDVFLPFLLRCSGENDDDFSFCFVFIEVIHKFLKSSPVMGLM